MQIYLMICGLIIPLIMIGFGQLFIKKPPKDINGIYGYRTAMSSKNKETWNFAHQYCGKVWRTTGSIMFVIFLITSIISLEFDEETQAILVVIFTMAQVIVMLVTIIPVEKALKKNFDEYGLKRK